MISKTQKLCSVFGIEIAVLLFLITAALLFKNNQEAPPVFRIIPGIYDQNLLIAFDPSTSEFSGLYSTIDSCDVYFVGKLTANKVNVVAWEHGGSRKIKKLGIFRLLDDGHFTIQLEERPHFCYANNTLIREEGDSFQIREEQPWQRLRSIRTPLTPIYARPDTNSNQITTLERYDLVKVIEKDLFWLKVRHGSHDHAEGWVRIVDLFRFPG
ncbi:MAG: SH3 domain-containing protein [Bacteroidota bacterium]